MAAPTSVPPAAAMSTPSPAEPLDGHAQARAMLRAWGLRGTTQRVAIVQLVVASGRDETGDGATPAHQTALEIRDRLRARGEHIDTVTVYRTLERLVVLGALHTINRGPDGTAYGLATTAHHHVVCRGCGSLSEIAAERVESSVQLLCELTGFRPEGTSLTIRGLCTDCQER